MRKIKVRLGILILSLISVISIMTIVINGEVKKVDNISKDYKDKLIRFHVIANSNTDEDQELKLKVRDEVIKYLQPKLQNSKSIEESEAIIKKEYSNLEEISKNIILENGYNYSVKVGIQYSNFPTKQYSNIVLPAGEYKALKIIIGKGEGKNWWCVMFPPLCFVDESNGVIDKSTDDKLKEVLTDKEYKLIKQDTPKKTSRVKIKFKVIEVVKDLEEKF
ncbi:stage II sporulation protein R [Clostridioides difficile]|nr:stage II sporulation protein R [Clostridioides difficile]UWD49294.1 stage II sporulation protein R [Clostridioides difficile]